MKHRLALLAFAILAVLAAGCVRAATPRGWASPVESGDLLLITAAHAKLDAIDRSTGERRWRFPDDWEIKDKAARKLLGIYAKPAVVGSRAYVADYNGYVYALDLNSGPSGGTKGQVLWSKKPGGAIVGGMTYDKDSGVLFVASDDGNIYALRAGDNSDQFQIFLKTGERIWSAPTVAGGRVYVGSMDGRLYALDARTAQAAWPPFKAGGALVSTPTVSGTTVLVGGFDSHLYAVSTVNRELLWSFPAANWVWSQPLVDSGTVYFADFDGNVYAVRLSDGQAVWAQPFHALGSIRSAPALSEDVIVVATDSGRLFGIDKSTGTSRWGPVEVGTDVNADLERAQNDASTVYIAPKGCSTQDQTTAKVYYFSLDGARGTLRSTDKVC